MEFNFSHHQSWNENYTIKKEPTVGLFTFICYMQEAVDMLHASCSSKEYDMLQNARLTKQMTGRKYIVN